jgi:hypothetical protein
MVDTRPTHSKTHLPTHLGRPLLMRDRFNNPAADPVHEPYDDPTFGGFRGEASSLVSPTSGVYQDAGG